MSTKRVRFPHTDGVLCKGSSGRVSQQDYLRRVKRVLRNQKAVYDEFLRLARELRDSELDFMSTIEQMITLLDGHHQLTVDLTALLPTGYEIEIQQDAVVVKVYELDDHVHIADTGHCRRVDTRSTEHSRTIDTTEHIRIVDTENTGRNRTIDTSAGRMKTVNTSKVGRYRTVNNKIGRNRKVEPIKGNLSQNDMLSTYNAILRGSRDRVPISQQRSRSQTNNIRGRTLTEFNRSRRSSPCKIHPPCRVHSSSVDASSKPRFKLKRNNVIKPANQSDFASIPQFGQSDTATVAYIKSVKESCRADQTRKYERFMDVLRRYHSKKCGELETVYQTISLFKEYPHLVLGFNDFLPAGYRIRTSGEHQYKLEYPR